MDRSREEAFVLQHDFAIDDVIDSLGFNGEEIGMDEAGMLIAANQAYAAIGQTPEERQILIGYLKSISQTLSESDQNEGQRASSMLSSFMWRVMLLESPVRPWSRHTALIDRSLQNIRITRHTVSYGDEKKFSDMFAFLTEKSIDLIERRDYRYMKKLCRYVDARKNERVQHVKLIDGEEQRKPSWMPHIIKGLAATALVQGHFIQPPENQRDENGAWQLPDETIYPDETDDI